MMDSEKYSYLPYEQRKKILFLSDDPRLPSGVGIMAREIIVNSCHHFNFVCVGATIKHPEEGKVIDANTEFRNLSNVDDAYVRIYPTSGYGTKSLVRDLIKFENPDALVFFTDPRFWIWLFEIENEIREKIPMIYINIWDSVPIPKYNKSYYRSVDSLFAISKQTLNINEVLIGKDNCTKFDGRL